MRLLIIRPPKVKYHIEQIDEVLLKYPFFRHSEMEVAYKGHKLVVSLIEHPENPPEVTIIYLHGNSSCRVEMVTLLPVMVQMFWLSKRRKLYQKVGLASFDFYGCGNTDGRFITLGCEEAEQIRLVVRQLKEKGRKVVLWGRSMGAASVIKYGGEDINVLDSPFSDLRELCKEFSLRAVPGLCCLIRCLYPCVFCCINGDIQSETGHDLGGELRLLEHVARFKE